MLGNLDLFSVLVHALVLLTAMPVHEFSHAFVADRLGDHTARGQGRLTLNPVSHLSLWGSFALIVFGFGWAKPVPVNPNNFKNPKWGMALSSLAGPLSNVLMAAVLLIIYKVSLGLMPQYRYYMPQSTGTILLVIDLMISINLYLAVFNFLPVPPLDGSKIFAAVLPEKAYFFMLRYERFVYVALVLLLYVGILSIPMMWLADKIYIGLDYLTWPINLLFG